VDSISPVESYAAQATMSSGALSAFASSQNPGDPYGGWAAAESIYEFAVKFSGAPSFNVPVTFNFAVDGFFETTGDANAEADFEIYDTSFQSPSALPGNTWFQACRQSGNGGPCDFWSPAGGAIPTPLPLGTVFQSNTFNVDTYNTWYFTIDLWAATWAANGSSLADFSHTAGFAAGTPVLNLPSGYTANSLDGLIVNDQFTGNTVNPAEGSSPEPSSLLMFTPGLGYVLLLSRRKRA
jgi:hypothetical protein